MGSAIGEPRVLFCAGENPWTSQKLEEGKGGGWVTDGPFLHCPNRHEDKRILLFEMEERGGELYVVNEVTGNWYDKSGGIAAKYNYRTPCVEIPCFSINPVME